MDTTGHSKTKEQNPEFEEIYSFSGQGFTIRRNGQETGSGSLELNLDAESPRLTLKFRDKNGFTGAHIDGPFKIRPNGELWLAVHDTSVRPSAEAVLAGQPRYIWRLKRVGAASRAADDAELEASPQRAAAASAPINPKLAEICAQAHAALTSIETLQYRFEQCDDQGWHTNAEFYADHERFRVNRKDTQGMMGVDDEGQPKRYQALTISTAFDGQRQYYVNQNNEPLRVKVGREGAPYAITTPQLSTYGWLRMGSNDFRFDTLLDQDLWERRFRDAIYIGEVTEDGSRFEIVDFPQRLESVTPCIYRVYFARDLGFLPLKLFRNTLAENEPSTTVKVTRFKTFTINGKQVAIPLELQYQETQADGVSTKGEQTVTVDEGSLKVNDMLDESLFALNDVDEPSTAIE